MKPKSPKALVVHHKLDMYPITLILAMNQAGINLVDCEISMPAPNSAATWGLYNETKGHAILVAVDQDTADDDILVHEAVHVFQRICRVIGEDRPGHEMEAYHIQYAAKLLIEMRNQLINRS